MKVAAFALALLITLTARANEAEIAALTERLNDIESWLESADDELRAKREALARFDAEIRQAGEEGHLLTRRLDTASAELITLGETIGALERERDAANEELDAFLVTIHRGGLAEPLKRLLSERDPAEFDRQARLEKAILDAQHSRLKAYQATLDRLVQVRALEEAKRGQITSGQATLDQTLAALHQQRRERQNIINELAASITDRADERDRLTADRSRLQALLDELPRSQDFVVPVSGSAWPVDGELLRRFGDRRMGQLRWRGLYFSAPSGAAVRAAAGGTVVFADHLRGFGLLTILDHGDDQLTLYGYTDTLFKRAGEPVRAGETIATAGQSGGQAVIGLYFEVREAGTSIDPLAWLNARGIAPK